MLRLVAPNALRSPISRVRSRNRDQHDVDDADRSQRQRDQAHRSQKQFMASKIVPIIFACLIVSQPSNAFSSL